MHLRTKTLMAALSVAIATGIAACGGSGSRTGPTSTQSSGSVKTPTVSATAFTNDYSAMEVLKPLAAEGSGKIAEILPDTTSSTRYAEFDAPSFKAAAKAAGLRSSDVISQNANGSDTQFLSDAEADITNGASVLLIDPEDSGTGVKVENYAKQHGVAVIEYDRLILGGSADYYVSFNNVNVGKLIGTGFVSCAKAWGVTHPNVIMMHGSPTDNNATQFSEGYESVVNPLFKSGKYTLAANTAGTWNPTSPAPDALAEFEAAYTAHPTANSALIPNDENAAPIITYVKSHGIKPNTFPITGQDATLTGLQNILSGYQCGTVYKAVYKEAQAAVALAIYLRSARTPPKVLLNSTTKDPSNGRKVRSVLLTPIWVTPHNMRATVIADHFVPQKQLCAGHYAQDCTKYGIKVG